MEYVVVLLAFLGMVVALGVVWHAASEGSLLERARGHASHRYDDGLTVELLQDLAAY